MGGNNRNNAGPVPSTCFRADAKHGADDVEDIRTCSRRSYEHLACRLMRVFQHSVTQRDATQRKSLSATEKCCVVFFTQRQTPQGRLRLLAALRKQIETTSIFPHSVIQSELRLRSKYGCGSAALLNGAVCCVKNTQAVAALRYAALRNGMLETAHYVLCNAQPECYIGHSYHDRPTSFTLG